MKYLILIALLSACGNDAKETKYEKVFYQRKTCIDGTVYFVDHFGDVTGVKYAPPVAFERHPEIC